MRDHEIVRRYEVDHASDPNVKAVRRRFRDLALDIARGIPENVHRDTATDELWKTCRLVEKALGSVGGEIHDDISAPADPDRVAALGEKTKDELESEFSRLRKNQQIAALLAVPAE